MDLVPYLSAVILIATVATILLAVVSYAAFKLRDKRKPKMGRRTGDQPVFFHRYQLPSESDDGAEGEDADDGARSAEEAA